MRKNLMLMVLMFGILVGVTTLISAVCTDSDGGKNYETKGMVTKPGLNVSDSCFDGNPLYANTLNEYYCNGETISLSAYPCPNSCSNGACVSGGISGVGPAEASAGSVAKTGTRTSSTGTKTTSSSAKKSSKICPTSWTDTTSADGVPCCIPKSGRTTGRFLGFMFRD